MRLFCLRRTQRLPVSIEEAWAFFCDPRNLVKITPGWLNLVVTSDPPAQMHPGTILTYRIRPFLRVPVTWVTEITWVAEPFFFLDEQRFGPYRFWHHQHFFTEVDGGVEVQDVIHYVFRGGPLAGVFHTVLVRPRLEDIFDFRRRALELRFGFLA